MKVLVTGGAGYLGSHLVDALRQAGHAVRVLDLQPVESNYLAKPGCDFIPGSISDPIRVAQAVQGMEVVYHLAWSFRAWRFYRQYRPEEEQQEIDARLRLEWLWS